MVQANSTLFDAMSDYPNTFDVLPRLVDGVDFLTGAYWSHLITGTQRILSTLEALPITYEGVTWPGGVTTIDDAFKELSRVDGGVATLTETGGYYKGHVTFAVDRFTRTGSGGTNPTVPLMPLINHYNDIEEGQASNIGKETYAGEFEVTFTYEEFTPWLIEGMDIRVNAMNGAGSDEIEIAWCVMEVSIG